MQLLKQKQIDALIICSRASELSIIEKHTPYGPIILCEDVRSKIIDQIQRIEKPPTAMLVTSDQVAAGMIISSQRNELSIPADLAIIGFNNEPIAGIMDITTIEIPLTEMGKTLFRQVLDEKVSHQEFKEKLIERGTV